MEQTYYLSAAQVAEKIGCSKPLAYKIIRNWNEKLAKEGKLIIRGRINRLYFEKQMQQG